MIKNNKKLNNKIKGTANRPRISVFRSNKHISVQLINDDIGKTIISVYDRQLKSDKTNDKASELGKLLAKSAKEKKISSAVFDRRKYNYHGKVKSIADGARKEGLKI